MSEVYSLAVVGFLPCLNLFRIYVEKSIIKTVSSRLLAITSLRMANLETFDLYLKHQREPKEGEEYVKWTSVKSLIAPSVMPRLRRYSLIYSLPSGTGIRNFHKFI